MIAELRGAIGSASAQQLYQKKKEYILSPGRAGGVSLQRLCIFLHGEGHRLLNSCALAAFALLLIPQLCTLSQVPVMRPSRPTQKASATLLIFYLIVCSSSVFVLVVLVCSFLSPSACGSLASSCEPILSVHACLRAVVCQSVRLSSGPARPDPHIETPPPIGRRQKTKNDDARAR